MRIILVICALIVTAGGLLFAIGTADHPDRTQPPDPMSIAELTTEVVVSVDPTPTEPLAEAEPPQEPGLVAEESQAKELPGTTPETRRDLVERIDERSIRLDDRFILRGNGTERDPFTISWELLASARDTIDAEQGAITPPPHIELLDGAWVRIDGYYSSPLVVEMVEEVLVTLNRWDGCCIGLPPTPFDCIETNLKAPINMKSKHLVRFGTITGRMKIQPFAIGTWLMGLYSLEEADIDTGIR